MEFFIDNCEQSCDIPTHLRPAPELGGTAKVLDPTFDRSGGSGIKYSVLRQVPTSIIFSQVLGHWHVVSRSCFKCNQSLLVRGRACVSLLRNRALISMHTSDKGLHVPSSKVLGTRVRLFYIE